MRSRPHTQRMALILCLAAAFPFASSVLAQQAPVPSPPPPNAVPGGAPAAQKTEAETANPVPADPNILVSLIFSQPEREAIAQARRQFSSHGTHEESEADLLDQLQGIMASTKPDEELEEKYYAQFYLESLMYHTPGDWMAWIKSGDVKKKFTQETVTASDVGITVVAVDKENITFEWKPKDWVWVSNVFKESKEPVLLNQNNHTVVFTLRTNQTLSAYDMKIVEGLLKLTPLDTEGKQATEKTLPAEPGTASAGVAPAGGKKAVSAGILKQYKKIEPPPEPSP